MPDCTRSGRLVKKANTGGGLDVSLKSTQDATKIEISDDEGELRRLGVDSDVSQCGALLRPYLRSYQKTVKPKSMMLAQRRLAVMFQRQKRQILLLKTLDARLLNHQLHLKDSLCGSTPSPRSFTWSTTRPQAFSNAVASREPSIHVMASTQGGTVAFVGSASNIDDTCCS